MENTLTVAQPQQQSLAVFGSKENFDNAQRMATALAHSTLVPVAYQNNMPNCLLALEMSNRMGASPFMVMQNLDIIEGRPSFNSKFAIASANNCGRFSPIRWRVREIGPVSVERTYWVGPKDKREKKVEKITIQDKGWTAYATDLATNEVLEGPEVTLSMAFAEGWYTKNGSKWPTMPDMMGRYRSAKFFVNMYSPEVLMGFPTSDELQDVPITEDADWSDVTHEAAPAPTATAAEALNQKAAAVAAEPATMKRTRARAAEPAAEVSQQTNENTTEQTTAGAVTAKLVDGKSERSGDSPADDLTEAPNAERDDWFED